jgi:hemoglobin-like flavoprotein
MHRNLIELSLELAATRSDDITPLVYERVFREHPAMVELFCMDTDDSVKGSMLSHALQVLLDFIGDRQFADMFIRDESVTHASYNVPPEVFATFYPTVAETIRDLLGPDWTDEMADAWHAAIAQLSSLVAHPEMTATAAATASVSG